MWNRHGWCAVVLTALLAGCGGGSPEGFPAANVSAAAQAAPLAADADTARAFHIASAQVLLDFAESRFAQFFPDPATNRYASPFLYRAYSDGHGGQTLLGVAVDSGSPFALDGVYVMGGPFGNAPLFVGPLSAFVAPVTDGTHVTSPPAVDAYVGTWKTCDSSFLGIFSLGEVVTFTKVSDQVLSLHSVSTRHEGNFCVGKELLNFGDQQATWIFRGKVNNGGTLMDRFILVNSNEGTVGAAKIAVALSNGEFDIAFFRDRDAEGFPTAIDTVFPRPYFKQ